MTPLQRLTKLRHILAPAVGLVTAAMAAVPLGVDVVFSILMGALVWGGMALVLAPASGLGRVRPADRFGFDPGFVTGELEQAMQRIRRLRSLREDIHSTRIGDSVSRICDHADAMIGDVSRSPGDYRRVRKPLAQYLSHVETIVERFAEMSASHAGLHDGRRLRAEEMLVDLEKVFADYTRRTRMTEAYDLDARIALLESEIRAEGIDGLGGTRGG